MKVKENTGSKLRFLEIQSKFKDRDDDDLSFEEVYTKYESSFRKLVYHVCRVNGLGGNYSEWEEVYQDALIPLIKADERYESSMKDGKGRYSFLRMCLYRCVKKLIDRKKLYNERFIQVPNHIVDSMYESDNSDLFKKVILKAKENLNDTEFSIFIDRHYNQMSYSELAKKYKMRKSKMITIAKEVANVVRDNVDI